MDLSRLAPRDLHENVRSALASPQGRVLREFLRLHCFMRPGPRQEPWEGEDRLAFRYGRMTLFQLLEFYEDPANFRAAEAREERDNP
jgi:hypothetical protein